jgi:transcription elongation factor GreB
MTELGADKDVPDESLALPAGAKNYVTPRGFERLRDELQRLMRIERPKIVDIVAWAAGNGDRSENGDYIYGKRRLREIDGRIRFLSKRLDIAEIVYPARQQKQDQVFFGATVTYIDPRGAEKTVTIVGVDEADLDDGKVSWASPLAKAMARARVGDVVELRTPGGVEIIEVLKIDYRHGT